MPNEQTNVDIPNTMHKKNSRMPFMLGRLMRLAYSKCNQNNTGKVEVEDILKVRP